MSTNSWLSLLLGVILGTALKIPLEHHYKALMDKRAKRRRKLKKRLKAQREAQLKAQPALQPDPETQDAQEGLKGNP